MCPLVPLLQFVFLKSFCYFKRSNVVPHPYDHLIYHQVMLTWPHVAFYIIFLGEVAHMGSVNEWLKNNDSNKKLNSNLILPIGFEFENFNPFLHRTPSPTSLISSLSITVSSTDQHNDINDLTHKMLWPQPPSSIPAKI